MKHTGYLVFAVLATLASNTFAQAPEPSAEAAAEADPEPVVVDEPVLEPEHVSGAKPTTVTAEPDPSDPEMTLDRLVLSSANRIDLNFFGDVSLVQVNDNPTAFALGPLGFQVTAHLADNLVGRTEYVVKFKDGDTVIDLERLYLEYRTERWAFVAGRTHTELGYWNTAFHHGTWLQLTIKRPRVVGFEEAAGVLATHSTGLTAIYSPKRGDSGLEAVVSVGNGRGRTSDVVQDTSDNNRMKSVLLRVGAVGIGHPALRFGANLVVDEIAPEPAAVRPLLPDKSIFEVVTGVFLALRGERVVVFSETYNVLQRGGGQAWQFIDGFVLAGYRFGAFLPFAQIEARRGDGLIVPYFNPDAAVESSSVPPRNFEEATIGVRYEVNAWSALKAELAASSFGNGTDYRAEINWSFGR